MKEKEIRPLRSELQDQVGIKPDLELLKELLADIEKRTLIMTYTDTPEMRIAIGQNLLDTLDFANEVIDISYDILEREENKHNRK